jgi:phosphopantetheine adenylyltransferase
MVKEVSKHGGDVSTWVPPNVEEALIKKFKKD